MSRQENSGLTFGKQAGAYAKFRFSYPPGLFEHIFEDLEGIGRSIAGSFVGGIAAIEWFKARNNVKGSTASAFLAAYATLDEAGLTAIARSGDIPVDIQPALPG